MRRTAVVIPNKLPIKAKHNTLGEIEIYGVRIKSNYSNNIMYMTIIDGDMLWVYDYETKLIEDDNIK